MSRPRSVLIVEDNADIRWLSRTTLALAGFRVIDAADGLTALHVLDSDRPDLVILDLGLPDVSGYVVREELAAHAHTRNIPVVIVTGSPLSPGSIDAACVLRKPVTPEELLQTVQRCLASGSPDRV